MMGNRCAMWESIGQGADHYHVSVYGLCGNEPLLLSVFGAVQTSWRRALLISSDLTERVLQTSHRLCYLPARFSRSVSCFHMYIFPFTIKVTFPFVWEATMGRHCGVPAELVQTITWASSSCFSNSSLPAVTGRVTNLVRENLDHLFGFTQGLEHLRVV